MTALREGRRSRATVTLRREARYIPGGDHTLEGNIGLDCLVVLIIIGIHMLERGMGGKDIQHVVMDWW